MSLVLSGSTSGSVTLQEPAVAGTTVIDLPATSGTMVVTGGAQTVQFAAGSASTPSITFTGDTNTGIFSPAADTIAFAEGGAEAMRIDSGGQLVVGSTKALGQATIYKNASGLQSSSPQLTLQNAVVDGASGDGPGINFANATGAIANIGSAGNGIMFFSNRATSGAGWSERMRIDSSGNVGIGTNSPSVRLQVAGSSNFSDSMQIFNNPTASAQGILFRNTFNVGGSIFSMGAATTNDIILWVGGSGTQGAITGNGAGINYSSNSDYRLKENVAPMTGALAKVSQLKPCTYIWKFDGSEGQGFIAHELQEVFPDAVTGKKDDVETYTDEDGNEQTKIKPQGVDTSFLVATLTAALQELKAIVDTQATKIAELEAKLEGTA